MSRQPLAEVFGHLTSDSSDSAKRFRARRLCPFNNKVPNCTKDKAQNPLGVCSIYHEGAPVITCPVRFREEWIIADDAAAFMFNEGATWSSLIEVRLNDANGKCAGNIDVVLAAYDDRGTIYDFGALEIQAVYISGNVRDPFDHYMQNPEMNRSMEWPNGQSFPRPDYLSSSRKRLAPQLLFKGGILHSWSKKMAVALNRSFFQTLPKLSPTTRKNAELAWFIYDLQLSETRGEQAKYHLRKVDEVYTKFEPALLSITTPIPGKVEDFIRMLQGKLDAQLESPPDNRTIQLPFCEPEQ